MKKGKDDIFTSHVSHIPALVEGLLTSLVCLAEVGELPGRPADCLILLCRLVESSKGTPHYISAHRRCPASAPPALLHLVPTLLTSGNVHWQSAAVVGLGCLAHCNHFVHDSASRLLCHSAVSLSFHNCPPARLSAAGQGLLSSSSPGLRAAVGWSLKQVSSMLPLLPLSEVSQRVPVLGLLGVVAQV